MKVEVMRYSRYKKHYSDCRTVSGSYDKYSKTIKVIIPEGRMKVSGVRGQQFSGYEFEFTNEQGTFRTTYRAVCKENAIKRLNKDFNPKTYKLVRVY